MIINLEDDNEEDLPPVLQKMLKEAQVNAHKYTKKEGDSLFLIISKSYMTSGVNRLLRPKKEKNVKRFTFIKSEKVQQKEKVD